MDGSFVRKFGLILACIAVCLAWARPGAGLQSAEPADGSSSKRAVVLDVDGPIGPATAEFITQAIERASGTATALVVIRLDTPGGLDASTRDIVKAILGSAVPVATFVSPVGARAASAGTYILYASHIAAMSPATNMGAATPVAIGMTGGSPRDRLPGKRPGDAAPDTDEDAAGDEAAPPATDTSDTMSRKAVNDSVAWIRSLADLRGRNADWAERAVREAVSITSEKALEIGVIDIIASDVDDLLEKADGRVVNLGGAEVTVQTRGLTVERLAPDWRIELLSVITSPTIAYLLLLVGIYGLVLEGYNPGAFLPGVVGAICLLLALYALQMLPVNYAGLGLILLGVVLMIAEVMVPSFGALGIGGIIAMVIGSIILIDTDAPGFVVSRPLIGAIAISASLGLMAILWFAVRARERPVVSGREQLLGERGTAMESFPATGEVFVHSERWTAESEQPVREGQSVEVIGLKGLHLLVRPLDDSGEDKC
ncbi:MAG: nodulation protein NfeD [Woeseiaceae bacterium]